MTPFACRSVSAALVRLLSVLVALVLAPTAAVAQDAAEAELVRAYAPVMRFTEQTEACGPGEAYRPIDVERVLGNREVGLQGPWNTVYIVRVGPTGGELGQGLAGYALDLPGDPLKPGCDYERLSDRLMGDSPVTVYGHVARQADRPDRIAVQYWLYYLFNDFNNTHEGDWEMIQLVFAARTPAEALSRGPEEVGYSQHEGAERAAWGDPKLEVVDGTHPVVYPATGSHANYYGEALYLGRSGSEGFGCDDTSGDHVQPPVRVAVVPEAPAAYRSEYPWLGYEGHWGERQPAFYNGPTGPNVKEQWTRSISWSETEWREESFAIPDGGSAGTTATGFFCSAVAWGSDIVRRATASPLPVMVVLLAALLALVWAGRRTAWRPSAPLHLARRRSVGQVLSATARMYAGDMPLFLGIGLLFVPVALVTTALQAGLLRIATADAVATATGSVNGLVAALAVVLGLALVLLGYGFVVAATAHAMLARDDGRPIRPLAAYARALRDVRPLLRTLVIAIVLELALGLSLLLLPIAVILLVRWSLLAPVVAVERHGVRGALRRSGVLVQGHWWKVLTLVIGLAAAAILVGPLLGALVIILTGAPFALVNLLASFVYVVTMPAAAIAAVYVYMDVRVRHETTPRAEQPRRLPAEIPLGPRAGV